MTFYPQKRSHSFENNTGPKDLRTDRRTDMTSYRDAQSHLKICPHLPASPFTLEPIWFPHWPAWTWTISLMMLLKKGRNFQFVFTRFSFQRLAPHKKMIFWLDGVTRELRLFRGKNDALISMRWRVNVERIGRQI